MTQVEMNWEHWGVPLMMRYANTQIYIDVDFGDCVHIGVFQQP